MKHISASEMLVLTLFLIAGIIAVVLGDAITKFCGLVILLGYLIKMVTILPLP